MAPILTFDIEDWFHLLDHPSCADPASWEAFPSHVERGVDRLLDLLGQHGQQATMFCLGWVAERYPSVIRKIAEAGHEIGSHSFDHGLVHRRTRTSFRADLRRSINVLEQTTGSAVTCFRAPGFSITTSTPWAFDELVEAGIEVDSSIFPGYHAHGGIAGLIPQEPCRIATPQGLLRELPISTRRIGPVTVATAGGGFFRITPALLMEHALRRDPYTMTYIHPHDLDPSTPVLPDLSLIRHWRSRVGRKSAVIKLDRILAEFTFTTVRQAVRNISWDTTPVIDGTLLGEQHV